VCYCPKILVIAQLLYKPPPTPKATTATRIVGTTRSNTPTRVAIMWLMTQTIFLIRKSSIANSIIYQWAKTVLQMLKAMAFTAAFTFAKLSDYASAQLPE